MIRLRPDELEALADFVREAKATHSYWKTVGALQKLFEFYWEHVNAVYGGGGASGPPCGTATGGNGNDIGLGFPTEGVVIKRMPRLDPDSACDQNPLL